MKVKIEFELDTDDKVFVDELLDSWTYDIRVSRSLLPGTWKIEY